MDLWTMIVLIVAISVIKDIIKSRNMEKRYEPERPAEDYSLVIEMLKDRVANLETIVLERDRERRFNGRRRI